MCEALSVGQALFYALYIVQFTEALDPYEVDTIITPNLQIRKLRQEEIKLLAQGHTARCGGVRTRVQKVGFY